MRHSSQDTRQRTNKWFASARRWQRGAACVLGALLVTFFAEQAAGEQVDEVESNAAPATANELLASQFGRGIITYQETPPNSSSFNSESDYWATQAVLGNLVFAYVDTQGSSNKNSFLAVVRSDNSVVEEDNDDGPAAGASSGSVVAGASAPQSGNVHIRVTGIGGLFPPFASPFPINYRLYKAVVDPAQAQIEQEDNNSPDKANPIRGELTTGDFYVADVDYYKVFVHAGARLVVIMDDNPDDDATFTDTELSILSTDGATVLAMGDNVGYSGTGKGDGNAAGGFLISVEGIYFIRVAHGGEFLALDNDYRFVVLVDGGSVNDDDADGVKNNNDNCPDHSNPAQADADGDGRGDPCDNCPSAANTTQADSDADGVADACDNAPNAANAGQEDTDADGVGDVADNCLSTQNTDQLDSNQDGIGDACTGDPAAALIQAGAGGAGAACGTCGAGMPLMLGVASFSLLCARKSRWPKRVGGPLLMGLFLCVGSHSALAAESDHVPKGLSSSDWSDIRAVYETTRHAAIAVQDGYLARNPGQAWRTHFDGRGFLTAPDVGDWSWGLELVSYGRIGAERTVQGVAPATSRCGSRVQYEWDNVLSEWYVNDARGLEHGYTLHNPPSTGPEFLSLHLMVCGDLSPKVSNDGRNVTFVDASGSAAVNYNGLTVIDANGAHLPAWFEPVADGLRLFVDDREARYPLTIDPIAQQAYLKASNTDAGDFFGDSVAVSGDTVIVGAHSEDSSATGVNGDQADDSAATSGSAYIFVRDANGVWSQQAYLKASNTGPSDFFGLTVSLSGDTAVVGAPLEDSNATGIDGNQADNSAADCGAAYVFVRNGTTWSQQAYLKASNAEAGDQFGMSVATSGDTVVVGANFERSNATGVNGNEADNSAIVSGAAYVFVRNGATWSQQAYLKASNTDAGDLFGSSVAASGDTVVVGALGEDSIATGVNGNEADDTATNAGAAYVFIRSGTTWTQQAYLKASNTDADDFLGGSVAVDGDTAVVGAANEDSNATGVNGDEADNSANSAGAAYIFFRDAGGIWSQQAYLKASNPGANDQFGHSVAASGDTVVVGAFLEDSNATGIDGNQTDNSAPDSGAAYVFVRDAGGIWTHQGYIKASNTGSTDRFSSSVAVNGDTVVIGANCESSGATGVNGNQNDNTANTSGAVFVFTPDTDGDGVPDTLDGCVTDPAKAAPGQCGCFNTDTDSDGDGTADCIDGCAADRGKTAAGICGCGVADTDSDGDGVADCIDECPSDRAKTQAGTCGCGVSDLDSDGDGVADCDSSAAADPTSPDALIQAAAASGSCGTCGAGAPLMLGIVFTMLLGTASRRGSRTLGGSKRWCVLFGLVLFTVGPRAMSAEPITQHAYLKASNPETSDFFGRCLAASGDTIVVAAAREDSSATGVNGQQSDNGAIESGAIYVFVRDASGLWNQQAYLKASNTDIGDLFGTSVAISGDTIVVGATGEDSNATGVDGNQADNSGSETGAAYVFVRNNGVWSQQAYLKASNTENLDLFGHSVSVNGDTVVVGAILECSNATGVNGDQTNNNAASSGAVYVFVRNGSTWSQQAYLKASNTDPGDKFGQSVSVSGDTLVVGANGEEGGATGVNGNEADNGAQDAGAAYVFIRDAGGNWSQHAYLKASNTGANDLFGHSVCISGDSVVVGAIAEDSNATGIDGDQANESASTSGAAYVFNRNGVTWSQQAYLKASNTGTDDRFGFSVSVSGNTLAVGARGEASNAIGVNGDQADDSAFFAGAAYVFVRAGGLWAQMAYLKASNTEGGDTFGDSVAVSGENVVVGAGFESGNATGVNGNQADNSFPAAGAAYVLTFDRDGDGVSDSLDACPDDAAKTAAGACGCGTADTDSDGDGVADCIDECPSDRAKTQAGTCGCGVSDVDSDGDGVADCQSSLSASTDAPSPDALVQAAAAGGACGACGAGMPLMLGVVSLMSVGVRVARRRPGLKHQR